MRAVFHGGGRFLGNPYRAGRKVDELCLVAEQAVLLLGQAHDHVVVERVDVVLPGFLVEDLLQLFEFFGVLLRQVGALGEILGDVIQFPLVLFERQHHVHVPGHPLRVQGDRFPAVNPDGAVAEHLVVLPLFHVGRVLVVERVHHRGTVHRLLFHSVVLGRYFQARGFEDGRGDVGDVMILAADFALGLDPVGPVHDEGVGLAAAVFALLEVAERRVPRHRPAGVVMRIGGGVTPDRVVAQVGLERGLQAVQHVRFVERAGQTAFATRAVVGGDKDQRVVQLPDPLQRIEDAADLEIDVFHLGGKNFHLPRV